MANDPFHWTPMSYLSGKKRVGIRPGKINSSIHPYFIQGITFTGMRN